MSRTNLLGLYRTIAEYVESAPEHVRGPDLFGSPPSNVMVQNYSSTWEWSRYASENAPWYAYYDNGMKLLKQGEDIQLFDIESDPKEQRDLATEMTRKASTLSDALTATLDELDTAEVDNRGIEVDSGTRKRLRDLGYID